MKYFYVQGSMFKTYLYMTFLGAVDFAAIPDEIKFRKEKKWPNFSLISQHLGKLFS